MTTHTKTFHVQAKQYSPQGEVCFYLVDARDMSAYGYVYVKPVEVTYEVPDDFDIRPQQIEALDAQIQATRAEFSKRITELQEQKARLLSIEMVATE